MILVHCLEKLPIENRKTLYEIQTLRNQNHITNSGAARKKNIGGGGETTSFFMAVEVPQIAPT